jgi:hypothetical protein
MRLMVSLRKWYLHKNKLHSPNHSDKTNESNKNPDGTFVIIANTIKNNKPKIN